VLLCGLTHTTTLASISTNVIADMFVRMVKRIVVLVSAKFANMKIALNIAKNTEAINVKNYSKHHMYAMVA
jgi:hypothetical protein